MLYDNQHFSIYVPINKQQMYDNFTFVCFYTILNLVIFMDKTDLRIVKTNKALYEALLLLMKEKTFEEIKISDLCQKALVNRSTFYAHYNDKYELLITMVEDLKQALLSSLKTNENDINTKEYFMEMLKILIDHIEDKKDIYQAILVNNRNGILMDILYDVANRDINERIKDDKVVKNAHVPSEVITKFYLGAIVNIGIEWIKNNCRYTKEELISYFNILIPDEI